ncbi:MAG: hypothetical protein V7K27_23060 [Nostoc sp.]|uniref:hypothetical protein n=1 Tax=Nostoc sp. TaxID=1180 RepID=UPI002FF92CFF
MNNRSFCTPTKLEFLVVNKKVVGLSYKVAQEGRPQDRNAALNPRLIDSDAKPQSVSGSAPEFRIAEFFFNYALI